MSLPLEIIDLAAAARQLLVELRAPTQLHCGVLSSDVAVRMHSLDGALERAESLTDAILTPDELAETWRISVKTVRGWIDDGTLRAFDTARGSVPRWRIPANAAIQFALSRAKRKRST